MSTLAERFVANKGAALDVEGQTVINMYQRPVNAGQKVAVSTSAALNQPIQGLRIKLKDGVIKINDQLLKEVVIWLDTAPSLFEFACLPKTPVAELRIWNCWRDKRGVSQSWIGNAGIVAEEATDKVVLHCSTGTAEFDPGQLTINLQFNLA